MWCGMVWRVVCFVVSGVSICALWPATAVQSAVTDKMGVPPQQLRKDTIFADAVLQIAKQTDRMCIRSL